MRYFFAVLMALVGVTLANAQVLEPAKFQVSVSNPAPKAGDKIELIITTTIAPGWYVYGSDFDPDLGPNLTEVKFAGTTGFTVDGKLRNIHPKRKHDDVWDGEVSYFKEKGEFRQTLVIKTAGVTLAGSVEGQVCNDKDGKCITFSDDFSIALKAPANAAVTAVPEPALKSTTSATTGEATASQPSTAVTDPSTTDSSVVAGNTGNDTPQPELQDTAARASGAEQGGTSSAADEALIKQSQYDGGSLLGFFLFALGSGLLALVTPCVFPLIPMTVSLFTKYGTNRGEGIRKALFYGFSIIAIYTFIGTVVSRINGPEFANFLSTHWAPNVFFFLLFLVFAISFLGAFDIVLPQNIVNKADRQADKGGYYGVFFMALTLALVTFSCTGPVVGSILVQSAGGEVLKPVVGMLGFSLAFAVPFTLFAIFPRAMQTLPRSGAWLNSVKVVLGFLELAFALKFLSIADQAYHWGILDREVFLSLWIVIFGLLGFYFLGKLRLPHDGPTDKTTITGLMLGIATLSFVVYLIPGLWGAPLKALSGYLPPQHTQDFDLHNNRGGQGAQASTLCDPAPRHSDKLHFYPGFSGYFDYNQALACAKAQNKPVFIDFTGHGCVNCREMETRVWTDPRVAQRLREKFVMLALFVDDKTTLPEKEWYTSAYDGKQKTTIGKQNADLQIRRFHNNAQPYYVLLAPDGSVLVPPRAYDLDPNGFIAFLDSGLQAFAARR